nr:hypothetical protein [Mycoplasmopsis bovis]
MLVPGLYVGKIVTMTAVMIIVKKTIVDMTTTGFVKNLLRTSTIKTFGFPAMLLVDLGLWDGTILEAVSEF